MVLLNENVLKFSALKAFFRIVGFGLIGFVVFSKPLKDVTALNALFSTTMGIFFGGVYRLFLIWFLKPFNRDLKEKYGKKVVKKALENGLVYIFPFSLIAFFSRFVLGISIATALFSSALLISAFSGANSINSLREKPRASNIVVAFIISFVFSTAWIYYSSFASKIPEYAEGGIKLLYMFLTGAFKI